MTQCPEQQRRREHEEKYISETFVASVRFVAVCLRLIQRRELRALSASAR
jgi:hypothetical protein